MMVSRRARIRVRHAATLVVVLAVAGPVTDATAGDSAKPVQIAERTSPDGDVTMTWYVEADEALELRKLDPDGLERVAKATIASGHVEPSCVYRFGKGDAQTTIRPARCSILFEPFSPDGRWVVLQRGDPWQPIEVVRRERLLAVVNKQREPDYRARAARTSQVAAIHAFIRWIGSRGFVFQRACCGYSSLLAFDVRTGTSVEKSSVYGGTAMWHPSPDGRWTAIGRVMSTPTGKRKRVDLVATDKLADYLFDGARAAASAQLGGLLAHNPRWVSATRFEVRTRTSDDPEVVDKVSVSVPAPRQQRKR